MRPALVRSIQKTAYLLIIVTTLFGSIQAQKKKPKAKIQPDTYTITGSGSGAGSVSETAGYKPEPYLSLEPCARETTEEIEALENAPDADEQVKLLVNRVQSDNEWLRACSLYRLGEFGSASRDALPVVLKIFADENAGDLWSHADDAIWKIPADRNVKLAERLRLAIDEDLVKRLYGVHALAHFRYPAGTKESKQILEALIEAAKDKNRYVITIALRGIERKAYWGEDTTQAIPVISDLIRNRDINPIFPLQALVPMGKRAFPAGPLLMDLVFETDKVVGKEEPDSARSYILRFTASGVLATFGEDLVPLLGKFRETHPYSVLGVLSRMTNEPSLKMTMELTKSSDVKIRAKAIESIPRLKSQFVTDVLPALMKFTDSADEDVRNAAISKIGSFFGPGIEHSAEVRSTYRQKVVPKLIRLLQQEKTACYAAFAVRDIGLDADAAIPVMGRLVKAERPNFCAESVLFDLGATGQKYLSLKQIEGQREYKKSEIDLTTLAPDRYNKAKKIKPKTTDKKSDDENIDAI